MRSYYERARAEREAARQKSIDACSKHGVPWRLGLGAACSSAGPIPLESGGKRLLIRHTRTGGLLSVPEQIRQLPGILHEVVVLMTGWRHIILTLVLDKLRLEHPDRGPRRDLDPGRRRSAPVLEEYPIPIPGRIQQRPSIHRPSRD
jgi:hypothetical protein